MTTERGTLVQFSFHGVNEVGWQSFHCFVHHVSNHFPHLFWVRKVRGRQVGIEVFWRRASHARPNETLFQTLV